MEIRRLEPQVYAGKKFTARYQTDGYYDIHADAHGFRVEYVPFPAPVERSFDDVFFNDWLEAPIAFGAFRGETLLGFAEGSLEAWNNRFCISNICVFERGERHQGVGARLMDAILTAAVESGARMAILETQTCNIAAINFYRKHGFELIGFDLYSYSNDDPERHEVRIEMGRKLK